MGPNYFLNLGMLNLLIGSTIMNGSKHLGRPGFNMPTACLSNMPVVEIFMNGLVVIDLVLSKFAVGILPVNEFLIILGSDS